MQHTTKAMQFLDDNCIDAEIMQSAIEIVLDAMATEPYNYIAEIKNPETSTDGVTMYAWWFGCRVAEILHDQLVPDKSNPGYSKALISVFAIEVVRQIFQANSINTTFDQSPFATATLSITQFLKHESDMSLVEFRDAVRAYYGENVGDEVFIAGDHEGGD